MPLESTTGARLSSGAASLESEETEEHFAAQALAEIAAPEDGRAPPERCDGW